MKSSEIKLLAMEVCMESDMTNSEKIKYLKFLKESSPYVSIGYLLDGKFYNLNEAAKLDLKKRFLNEQGYHPYRKTFFAHYGGPTGSVVSGATKGAIIASTGGGAKKAIAGGVLGAGAGLAQWAGYRLIRSTFDKCTKECGTFKINNPKRQLCLFKCKEKRLEAEIGGLKKIHATATEIAEKQAKLARLKDTIARYEARFK